jgi:hypothetical protein
MNGARRSAFCPVRSNTREDKGSARDILYLSGVRHKAALQRKIVVSTSGFGSGESEVALCRIFEGIAAAVAKTPRFGNGRGNRSVSARLDWSG